MNIKNHPTDFILDQFVSGNIDDHLAIIVSAHIESCGQCSLSLKDKEQELAQQVFSEKVTSIPSNDDALSDMISLITQELPVSSKINERNEDLSLFLSDRKFELPRALIPLKEHMTPWKSRLGKLFYSPVNVTGASDLYFLYLTPGVQIPTHTHRGNEFMYVVAGSFNDESTEYSTGDFASFNASNTHSPKTDDPEGCLILTSVDAPFHFTKGWSRLLNPVSQFLIGH